MGSKLHMSKSQQRAVWRGKALRYVPYVVGASGACKYPRGHFNFCTPCACYDPARGCLLGDDVSRSEKTGCDKYARKDRRFGYWKEVKE